MFPSRGIQRSSGHSSDAFEIPVLLHPMVTATTTLLGPQTFYDIDLSILVLCDTNVVALQLL